MRDNISHNLGLVNGYFFGMIMGDTADELPTSNSFGGAAEDIERSLRQFNTTGILRLNFNCNREGLVEPWRATELFRR